MTPVLSTAQPQFCLLANLKYFFAGQDPTFYRTFQSCFCRTPPVLSRTIGPTPQTYVYTPFYIKMQATNFAGHLAEFAGQQDI